MMGFLSKRIKNDALDASSKDEAKKQKKLDKAAAKAAKKIQRNESYQKTSELHDFSKIVKHETGLKQGYCSGCIDEIGGLLDRWKSNGKAVSLKLTHPVKFHNSFSELEDCCEKCLSCRTFRQALLLRQPSRENYEELLTKQEIQACLLSVEDGPTGSEGSVAELWIKILIGDGRAYTSTAFICCSTSPKLAIDFLGKQPKKPEEVAPQITRWLKECKQNHSKPCRQLNWSNRNPTRLIYIQANQSLQLVEAKYLSEQKSYMALSYVWGGKKKGNTLRSNVADRLKSFSLSEILPTLQDTIKLAHMIGFEYVWIDALCIIQDSDDDRNYETSLMHEYYGNAHFTLYIISGLHAAEGFLYDREAWSYWQLSCQIDNVILMNIDTTIDEARSQSPHATRGWTLQEEYLSPRRLYWNRNNIYWSCAAHTAIEGITESSQRPTYTVPEATQLMSSFLLASFKNWDEHLHHIWLGIVESFAKRDLAYKRDKAKAISGVASRCLDRKGEYVAGLWSNTLAEEIVWKLTCAGMRDDLDKEFTPPSWSWLSLPLMSDLRFQEGWIQAKDFEFLQEYTQEQDRGELEIHERIDRGSLITQIWVKGRTKPFWGAKSRLVGWEEIVPSTSPSAEPIALEDISFEPFRSQDVHSVDTKTGVLAVSEKHYEEIVAQLDYLDDALLISKMSLDVEVIEAGQDAMVLLCRTDGQDGSYRRVGACHGIRRGFFDRAPVRELCLK